MCYSKFKWRKFTPSEEFTSFAKTLNSVAKLTNYIGKNFTYKSDPPGFFGDYWQTPEETWRLKTFDCEDMGLFNLYILTQMGIEAKLVTYAGYDSRNEYSGHAVCVTQDGYFSNNKFYLSGKSIIEIGRVFYPNGLTYMEVLNSEGKTLEVKLPKYLLWGKW